jgi:hypothetical protein
MSSWLPLVLAVWLGVSSACLAAEPHLASRPPAVAPAGVDGHDLSLDLALRAVGLDGSGAVAAAQRAEAAPDHLARPGGERRMRRLALHLGRTSSAGRSPGAAPPLYGEVGIDLDPAAGLSLVPSYRLVLDEGERAESGAVAAQVLKLGARIRF